MTSEDDQDKSACKVSGYSLHAFSRKFPETPNLTRLTKNKANLRDLIAATGLVISLKLDSNRRFFSLCDLEIWWMTQKKQ